MVLGLSTPYYDILRALLFEHFPPLNTTLGKVFTCKPPWRYPGSQCLVYNRVEEMATTILGTPQISKT